MTTTAPFFGVRVVSRGGYTKAPGPIDPATKKAASKRRLYSTLALLTLLGQAAPVCAEESPIDVDADHLDIDRVTQEMVARGNVVVRQQEGFELKADQARYQGLDNTLSAEGNVRFSHEGSLFTSDRVVINVESRLGEMDNVTLDMVGPGGRGGATKVKMTQAKHMVLTDGWYTNCDCEDPPWKLAAGTIIVDQDANNVEAKHVKFYLGDVPVAYFPWWRQPLRQEPKSGFLRPDIRSSGGNGLELELPYYWRIAPNRDLTVALRGISQRGMMGKLEHRYLGLNYNGSLNTQQIYDTQEERQRGLTTLTHEHHLWGWHLSTLGQYSQSRNYINDFSQKLVDEKSRRLASHLSLDRQWIQPDGYTDVQAGINWYQDLEQTNDDFTIQQLPYFSLSQDRPLSDQADGRRWRLQNEARLDNFYQLSGDSTQRLDLAPTVRYQRPLDIGHLSGRLGVRETAYLIHGTPNQSTQNYDAMEHREASVASLRLDSQLRKTLSGNRMHTIEPSIEYVINATTDQSPLPNYDATLRNFNTSNLYLSDQYSGVDRISNGQWISYGITSRLLSLVSGDSLMETATLKIGQRWAPDGDREYQAGKAFSDVVSTLDLQFVGGWAAKIDNRFDPHQNEVERTDAELRYTRHNQDTFAVGYHFNQPNTLYLAEDSLSQWETLSLQGEWHLSDRLVYRQTGDYSLESSQLRSWESQLEYVESCWSLGLKTGNNLSADTANHGGQFFGLIFTLRGLGGYGK